MGVTERRARHKEALRQQILEAAREVFVTEGYESVSMRKIAEKIEYSPTTIYLYFKDKADLLNCLCEDIFERLGMLIEPIFTDSGDPITRLKKGMRTYVEFGLANPNDYRVAFLINVGQRGDMDQQPMTWKAYGFLRSTVEECIRSRRLRELDLETATQAVWSATHGITSLLIIHRGFPWADKDRLIDLVIAATVNGLSAGASAQ
jgi:AcrR family transcriptional regulator